MLGVAVGLAGIAVIDAIGPTLSATVGANPGGPVPQNVSLNGGGKASSTPEGYYHTVAVHLTAPVTITVILLAVLLALAGGLIAGSLGSWSAARRHPAAALAHVG